MATAARPDFTAHHWVVRADFPEVVVALRELLGAKLVAYLGGVNETRAVRQWAEGDRVPSEVVRRRLMVAYQVAATIAADDAARVAQAWMQGLNPQLQDRSPARLLRDGDPDEVGPEVIGAMRAFLVGG